MQHQTITRETAVRIDLPCQDEGCLACRADAHYRGLVLDQVRELDFKVFLRAVELVSKRHAV